MRVFVFRFHSPMLINVVRRFRDEGTEVLYWEGSKHYFDALRKSGEFPKTMFHNTIDAVRGIPALGLDVSSFEPAGKNLLETMSPHEAQIIRMMDAVDIDGASYAKKKHLYTQYLSYWSGLLEKMKPDAILFADIPHIAHQYTLYALAKQKGVRTLMLRTIPVFGRLIFFSDHTCYDELAEEVHKTKGKLFNVSDLSADARLYYERQTNLRVDAHPFYMKHEYIKGFQRGRRLLPNIQSIFQHLRDGTLFTTVHGYFGMLSRKRRIASIEGFEVTGFGLKKKMREWQGKKENFREEHSRFVTLNPDYSRKFIYVALHKQPEASTSAMGDVFVDQLLMVEMLSRSLLPDWFLYVKESPLQWVNPRAELGRYPGYYEEMARYPNVILVPTDTDTFMLTELSQAVASVTGTVGFEAVLRGKPALAFGHIWYQHCDGVFKVQNFDACKQAICEIAAGSKPDKQKVLNFMVALDRGTVRGFPNLRFQKDTGIGIKENVGAIAGAFGRMLGLRQGPN